MSVFPPNRYHEIEPARVQHGRSFVTAHQPSNSVIISTTNSSAHNRTLQPSNQQNRMQQQQQTNSTLPTKNVTLSTSTRNIHNQSNIRNGNDTNNTTLNGNQRTQINATQQRINTTNSNNTTLPIPSPSLHPNHITDVFPDALTSLTKTEEHTYSGSHNPTNGYSHDHAYTVGEHAVQHNHPYTLANSHAHHKVPLRMPIGPNLPQQTNGAPSGNIFEPNQSGMEDSTYQLNTTGIVSATPHLAASLASDRVPPLQRENLRLVRSNNSLQAHLIAESERIEECERQWASEMRQIKTKHTDLQFLFAQKTRKIANQEQKINELQSRLEQVLSDRQAYVKESIECTSRLPTGPVTPFTQRTVERSPSEIDQMRAYESKIAELTAELNSHTSKEGEWEKERSVLQSKISTRDEEVKRLSEVLESERNWDKIHVEFELKQQVKTITKLQQQVDFLNHQRVEWEKDTKSFKEMGVSDSYMKQLHASQAQTQHMEQEYQQAMQRVGQLQHQIEQQRGELEKLELRKMNVNEQASVQLEEQQRQMHELQRKYDSLLHENEQRGVTIETLRTQLDQTRSKLPTVDVPSLQENFKREEAARLILRDQYTKLVREHDELSNKFNQATNELSMLKDSSAREISNLQSDLLRAQYLNDDFQRRLRDLSETKATLSEEGSVLKSKVELTERMKEGLGGERDYYKQQVQELNGQIANMKIELQQRTDEFALVQRQAQQQEHQLQESIKDRSKLLQEQQSDSLTIRSLESQVEELKSDLQQQKHLNKNLNDIVVEKEAMMTNLSDMNVTQRGLVRTNEKMKVQIDALAKEKEHLFQRLGAITQERDSLLQSLSNSDGTLSQVQTEMKQFQEEREEKEQAYANLYEDYNQVSNELNELKGQKIPATQLQLQHAKQEIDKLTQQLRHVSENTVSKLSQTEQALRAEISNLKLSYSDLQHQYEKEQEDVRHAHERIHELEQDLASLRNGQLAKEGQLHSKETLLTHHTDLIAKLNQQISELKQMCRQTEGQKSKIENEWKHLMTEFDALKGELHQQMELYTNSSLVISQKQQEIIELKSSLNSLAEQKNQIEIELHETQVKNEELRKELQHKDLNINQVVHGLNENSAHTSVLQETLRSKDYELAELIKQIRDLNQKTSKLQTELSHKVNENKGLIGDLEKVITENQLVASELNSCRSAMESQSNENERWQVKYGALEESYRAKELECLDLLSNYRSVTLENERIKLGSDELEHERKNYRTTLKQSQDALFNKDNTIRQHESELRKRMVDLQSYEQTVQELTRQLEHQKKSYETLLQEKKEIASSLESMKQLSIGMESSRHDHLRILTEYKSQLAKQQADLNTLQIDNTHLINTLQQSKDHSANLEKIIIQLRGQNVLGSESQMKELQEKNVRLGQLSQELADAKLQIDNMNEQIRMMNEYRDKQNQEINRSDTHEFLVSSGAAPSGQPASPSSKLRLQEFQLQTQSLQQTINTQFAKIQELNQERTKLKSYIVKYEAELRSFEARERAAKASSEAVGSGSGAGVNASVRSPPPSMNYSLSSNVSVSSFVVENA